MRLFVLKRLGASMYTRVVTGLNETIINQGLALGMRLLSRLGFEMAIN